MADPPGESIPATVTAEWALVNGAVIGFATAAMKCCRNLEKVTKRFQAGDSQGAGSAFCLNLEQPKLSPEKLVKVRACGTRTIRANHKVVGICGGKVPVLPVAEGAASSGGGRSVCEPISFT